MTGDGFQDLIIGQPYAGGSSDSGIVYIYNGSTTGLPSSGSASSDSVSGEGYSNLFGTAVAYSGGDLIVGAPGYNNTRGKLYLYHGNSTGVDSTPAWTYEGSQDAAQLGFSLAGNVDVDATNGVDFVAGEPTYNHDGSTLDSGRVLVFRVLSSGLPSTSAPGSGDILDGGHQAGARFGYAVALGSINQYREGVGDSIGDIIIGAPRWDINTNDDKGKVFIYYGTSGSAPDSLFDAFDSNQGSLTGEYFGFSVAWVRKLTSAFDLPCVAGGAPRATVETYANSGLVSLYQFYRVGN